MTYTEGEIILTAAEVREYRKLLVRMTADQIEQLAEALEYVCQSGHGSVSVKVYRGHPRFIDLTLTTDLRE